MARSVACHGLMPMSMLKDVAQEIHCCYRGACHYRSRDLLNTPTTSAFFFLRVGSRPRRRRLFFRRPPASLLWAFDDLATQHPARHRTLRRLARRVAASPRGRASVARVAWAATAPCPPCPGCRPSRRPQQLALVPAAWRELLGESGRRRSARLARRRLLLASGPRRALVQEYRCRTDAGCAISILVRFSLTMHGTSPLLVI